jgi:hypothetical protein
MDSALSFDVLNNLGHSILGRDAQQHVHVIAQHVPLLDHAFALLGELVKHTPHVAPQLPVETATSTLRNEYDMVLALPTGVIKAGIVFFIRFLSRRWFFGKGTFSFTLPQT